MATLEAIQARIAKLQAQAETLVVTKSTAVLDKIRGLMQKHGLTIADVDAHGGKRRGRKSGTSATAKKSAAVARYADPKTGATWSGHGRAPAWIANAKDRSKFLVVGASSSSKVAAKPSAKGAAAKSDNYARGPQPPLYRDPRSGATWSGRGPAPAWLAGAKDRSKFLIAKAEPVAATKAKAVKAAPAKKAVAKKAAVKNVAAKKAAVKKTGAAKQPAPAKKAAAKKSAAAKSPVAREASAPKRAMKSSAVNTVAAQTTGEVAST